MQGIRKRLSYQRYKKALDFLKTNPTTAEILRYIYRLEDSNCVFGSISKSEYARESLEHLIKDGCYGQGRQLWLQLPCLEI